MSNHDFCDCYINCYLANGGVVATEFGDQEGDELAYRTLSQAFPDRKVVQVRVDALAGGGGSSTAPHNRNCFGLICFSQLGVRPTRMSDFRRRNNNQVQFLGCGLRRCFMVLLTSWIDAHFLAVHVPPACPRGLGHYLRQHFLDKTFVGLYQVNAFDLALLIPYFIVLIILAAYAVTVTGWSTFITSTRRTRHRTASSLRQLAASDRAVADLQRAICRGPASRRVCRLDYPKTNSTSSCSTIRPTRRGSCAHPRRSLRRPRTSRPVSPPRQPRGL